MLKSITIIAFDQHAATTVAAVVLPGHRTPALHSLTSDSGTILRFVERVRRQGPVQCCYEAGPAASSCSARSEVNRFRATHRAGVDSTTARRSDQDGSTRCRPVSDPLSRRRVDPDSHSDRAGGSRPRSAAMSRGHSCRSVTGPHRLSKFLLAPWPPLHRHQGPGRNGTTWLRAQAWPLAGARADPRGLSAHGR